MKQSYARTVGRLIAVSVLMCAVLCGYSTAYASNRELGTQFVSSPLQSLSVLPAADQELQSPLTVKTGVLAEMTEKGSFPLIVLECTLQDGYYAYSHTETHGRPLSVQAAAGVSAAASILYPQGVIRPDMFESRTEICALQGHFDVFVRLRPEVDGSLPSSVDIDISLLACSAEHCFPVDTRVSVFLPDASAVPDVRTVPGTAVSLSRAVPAAMGGTEASFAVLSQTSDEKWVFTPRYSAGFAEPHSLVRALLLGCAAGLILNVMPCVLPVLSLKLASFMSGGAAAPEEGRTCWARRRFRRYALAFSAGIMTWFAMLGAAFSVPDMLWGELFRSTAAVLGVAVLIFMLGLSLLDVFYLPVFAVHGKSGSGKKSGDTVYGAFTAGLLATLLATPCSGPLLGGVLGWSVPQPPFIRAVLFVAVGFGMAFPYLVLAAFPGMVRFVPNAGAWTHTAAKIVAVMLFGTSIYLISVLPQAYWFASACTLGVALLCAFVVRRLAGLSVPVLRRRAVWGLGAACLVVCVGITVSMPVSTVSRSAFDAAAFRDMLGRERILVEFTADWCPTCKVIERTVLTPDTLKPLEARYGTKVLIVDLTRPDTAAESLLRALGSVSIPFAALFPKGEEAHRPVVLRDVFTADQLRRAAHTAWGCE